LKVTVPVCRCGPKV